MQCVPVDGTSTVQSVHRAGSLDTHGGAVHGAVWCSTQGRGRGRGCALQGCLQALSCIPLRRGPGPGACAGVRCPALLRPVALASCPCLPLPAMVRAAYDAFLWGGVTHRRTHASLGVVGSGQGRRKRVPHTTARACQPIGPWEEGILGARDGPSVSRACRLCCFAFARASVREKRENASWADFAYGPIFLKRDPGPDRVLQNFLRLSLSRLRLRLPRAHIIAISRCLAKWRVLYCRACHV